MAMPRMRAALAGHELLETTTLQQSERLVIEDIIDLFVIGIHFDDSRTMELVKLIRLDPKHKETPILITRLTPSSMAEFIQQTMETMKSLRVVTDYLELEDDPMADVKIRDTVSRLLPAGKRLTPKKNNKLL